MKKGIYLLGWRSIQCFNFKVSRRMMSKIVECVPNFSEGQRKEVIDAIAHSISQTDGCSLLDVDPGSSTNRTVYTFVGSPQTIVEGALNASKVAYQLINMAEHVGSHPRMGTLDVCPFIPVQGVTMQDCIDCANIFGERLANELGVPVYLYAEAARKEENKRLPTIRSGEYEALPEKLSKPEFKPDFGPADFISRWGATVTGARKFLIAYNINLLGTKEQAHRLALDVREQGRGDDKPGKFGKVQAIGWFLDESNLAQVSVNILDHEQTPMHLVFEEIKKGAQELNLTICGSQIVGLVPISAIMAAADYYIERENLFILEDDQKVRLAIDRLGLNSLGLFDPKERIIEFMVGDDSPGLVIAHQPKGQLASMNVCDFVMTVGARTPSPGGGSVAALISSLGASLAAMSAFLTYGNRKFEALDSKMRVLLPPLYRTSKALVPFIDADAMAFSEYMASMKLPRKSEEERKFREEATQAAMVKCIEMPMNVIKHVNSLWPTLKGREANNWKSFQSCAPTFDWWYQFHKKWYHAFRENTVLGTCSNLQLEL